MVQCNYLVKEVFSPKVLLEHRFCDIGAEVLNLSIGVLLSICIEMNICTLNSPTSQSREPLERNS
jgi:hypothetical protein